MTKHAMMSPMTKRLGMMLVCVLALSACGGGDEPGETAGFWANYDPSVKERLETVAASGDCAELQAEFDTADANDDVQRNRTGEGNADLMAWLDAAMSEAGCYD